MTIASEGTKGCTGVSLQTGNTTDTLEENILFLKDTLSVISRSGSINTLLSNIVKIIKKWTKCDAIGIFIPHKRSKKSYEINDGIVPGIQLFEGIHSARTVQYLFTDLMEEQSRHNYLLPDSKVFYVSDLTLLADWKKEIKIFSRLQGAGFESAAFIPLQSHSRYIGLLVLANKHGKNAIAEEAILVNSICRYLVNIIRLILSNETLLEKEQIYHDFFTKATDGMFILTKEAKFMDVNMSMTANFGTSRKNIINRPDLPRYSPVRKILKEERKRKGVIKNVELSSEHTDINNKLFFLLTSDVIKDKNGDILRYHGVLRDITEQRRAEYARRASEEKFRTLVENAPVGIEISTLDGQLILANKTLLDITGYTIAEIVNVNAEAFWLDPADRQKHMELNLEGIVRDFETRIVRKDGTSVWCSITSIPMEIDDVKVISSIIQDITKRKEAEKELKAYHEQLEDLVKVRTSKLTNVIKQLVATEEKLKVLLETESNLRCQLEREAELKAEFMRAIVHELKTPLTPLLAASDQMLNRVGNNGELLQHAKRIDVCITNMSKKIDELMDLAKGELRLLNLNYDRFDICGVIRDILDILNDKILSGGQEVTLDMPVDSHFIWADEERIRQTLLNLLDNAMKFTRRGGKICLRLIPRATETIIQVIDSGCGIEPDMQKVIFQPHSRFRVAREYTGGLGLGLGLCKMYVELHGGDIWVDSESGKGTTFSFRLPNDA